MTEDQWVSSTDPQAMLDWLRQQGKLSERKTRLFTVGCCRMRWDLLPHNEWRQAVEVSEQYVDGQSPEQELGRAWEEANDVFHHLAGELNVYDAMTSDEEPEYWAGLLATLVAIRDATDAAKQVAKVAKSAELQEAPYLLRDIFRPLPFRPLALPPSVRTWNEGIVRRLAQEAYNHRVMPSGQLAPDRLAVLVDALLEAGCDDADILGHLRGPGPHWRGCHVVDLILDKR